jgi:hypothetical protein
MEKSLGHQQQLVPYMFVPSFISIKFFFQSLKIFYEFLCGAA